MTRTYTEGWSPSARRMAIDEICEVARKNSMTIEQTIEQLTLSSHTARAIDSARSASTRVWNRFMNDCNRQLPIAVAAWEANERLNQVD